MKLFYYMLLLVLIFSMSSVHGIEDLFTIEATTVVNEIYPGESAEFRVTIHNYNDYQNEFRLSFGNIPRWSFMTEPVHYLSSISVSPGKSITFPLFIKSTSTIPVYGVTGIMISAKSKVSNISRDALVTVLLKNPALSEGYLPSVSVNAEIAERIDPRQKVELKVTLWNKNSLNIEVLDIAVKSKNFNTRRTVSLGPLAKSVDVFEINYDPYTPPIKDVMTITATVMEYESTPVKKDVEIISYSDIKKVEQLDKYFLKRTKTITYTNNGNTPTTPPFKEEASFFGRIFTSSSPKYGTGKYDGKSYLTWDITLAPKESATIVITKNYRPLFYIIVLIVLAVIGYYLFRSPIVIRKDIKILKVEDEGISYLKVLLHLRNRVNRTIENVKVIDRLPHIVNLEKDFAPGTLAPEKVIKHEHKGIIIKWVLPHLEPYEERIITYKVFSRLKIIGGLVLPPAIVKFSTKGDKFTKVFSNKVNTNK